MSRPLTSPSIHSSLRTLCVCDVIRMRNEAEASVIESQVKAFGTGAELARYAFYGKIAPQIRAILSGDPIDIYNHGKMQRDFTYIDDLVTAIIALADTPPGDHPVGAHDSLSPVAPFRVVNIGASQPTALMDFIAAIETAIGQTAQKRMMGMQPGDVPATWAETRLLHDLTGVEMTTSVTDGVQHFVDWYRTYYQS